MLGISVRAGWGVVGMQVKGLSRTESTVKTSSLPSFSNVVGACAHTYYIYNIYNV